MRIHITTIEHKDQRYPTTGDWIVSNDPLTGEPVLLIRVSQMGPDRSNSWPMEALVGIHEAIEAILALRKGIYQEDVDKFDMRYEFLRAHRVERNIIFKNRATASPQDISIMDSLEQNEDAEPGDCDAAPYYTQHQFATAVERMMAVAMDVSWEQYEAANAALYDTTDTPLTSLTRPPAPPPIVE